MKKVLSILVVTALLISLSTCALAATGLGSYTSVANKAATEGADGSVSVNTTMCAVTLDEDGKITAISFDVVQSKAAFDATGALKSDEAIEPNTKVELGEGYGMKAASAVGKEWFEQMEALEAWCIGKTVEEVLGMPTYDKGDGHHDTVSDDVDLKTSCTVTLGDQFKALEKAAAAAK